LLPTLKRGGLRLGLLPIGSSFAIYCQHHPEIEIRLVAAAGIK
jgi:hypothetical protein